MVKARGTKRGGRGTGWIVGGSAVVLLAAAYAGGAWFLGGQVPAGTSVHGVDIGGLDADRAAQALREELVPIAERDIAVTAGGRSATIDPQSAGLVLDIPATLAEQTGFSLDPEVLWHRVTGGGPLAPVLTVDESALRTAVQSAATRLDSDPIEGEIAFKGAKPEVTEPEPGSTVDTDGAADAVSAAWFDASNPIALTAETTEPAIPAEAYAAVLKDQARPLVAGPVTIRAGNLRAALAPADLAAAASFTAADGTVTMKLDNAELGDALLKANPDMRSTAKDARIVLSGGRPAVVPAVPGRGVDTSDLAAKILTAASTASRTASLELSVTQPELTTAEAKALGVKDSLVHFTSPYPKYDSVRTKNLRVGSARVNGVLVLPGETFSLSETLGPITTANGYFNSGVVVDGFSSEAVGGGLSQISTQTFNAGFLAGMDDVEHQPHSRWFDRYPAGREATIWEGVIDMKWRNNTDHAVMIQAWVDDRVHTRLWGTKKWDVKTTTSEHYDLKNPTTVYNEAEDCAEESGGQKGFTVTVTRERTSAAASLPKETLKWTYRPWNKVVCGAKP
ncbi:VanW family protein [Arthrobacter sp. KK5.5]|uniref:VanW family protein n=1 Tax=Arthrobacter sp. KK5.5 TaxID=3373084 RepID=UPI003EE6DE73